MTNDGSDRNLFVSGPHFTVLDVDFVGGSSVNKPWTTDGGYGHGGSVYIKSRGDVRIVGCTFRDGVSGYYGGNLYVDTFNGTSANNWKGPTSLSVEDSTFFGGQCTGSGGNMMVTGTSAISITDSIFDDGYSESMNGWGAGGLMLASTYGTMPTLDILNCSFNNNKGDVGAVDSSLGYFPPPTKVKVKLSGNSESGSRGNGGCSGMQIIGECRSLSEDFTLEY